MTYSKKKENRIHTYWLTSKRKLTITFRVDQRLELIYRQFIYVFNNDLRRKCHSFMSLVRVLFLMTCHTLILVCVLCVCMFVSVALNIIIPITFITSFFIAIWVLNPRHFFPAFFYDFLIKSNIMIITTMIMYIFSYTYRFFFARCVVNTQMGVIACRYISFVSLYTFTVIVVYR